MESEKLFGQFPIFETDRLILRQITLEDAADYFALASSPAVTAQTTWDTHRTLEDSIHYIKKIQRRYEQKEEVHWGIALKATNRVIGRTGLIRIDPDHSKAELGYVLSDAYWNKGITTEATRAIVAFAFEQLGLNRLEARCNAGNVGSYKVMEKLGLTLEGILRKQLKIKGTYTDQRMYAILKADYFNNETDA